MGCRKLKIPLDDIEKEFLTTLRLFIEAGSKFDLHSDGMKKTFSMLQGRSDIRNFIISASVFVNDPTLFNMIDDAYKVNGDYDTDDANGITQGSGSSSNRWQYI